MSEIPTAIFYCGRRIADLSREELIEALTEAVRERDRFAEHAQMAWRFQNEMWPLLKRHGA